MTRGEGEAYKIRVRGEEPRVASDRVSDETREAKLTKLGQEVRGESRKAPNNLSQNAKSLPPSKID